MATTLAWVLFVLVAGLSPAPERVHAPASIGNIRLASVTELAPNSTTGGMNINLLDATAEANEDTADGSRWWKYTATSSYSVDFDWQGWTSGMSACVTTSISLCSEGFYANSGTTTVSMTSGTTYYFRFTSNGDSRGIFKLTRGTPVDSAIPGNDNFADAKPIPELAAGSDTDGIQVDLANATTESGEAGTWGGGTAWWKYTPTSSQTVNVLVSGWNGSITTCVTTAIGSCTEGSANNNGNSAYALSAHTTYYIRLTPNGADSGTFVLMREGNDNDAFANATTIAEPAPGARTAAIAVDVSAATIEPGEVDYGNPRSLWWKYTPSADSVIDIDLRGGSNFYKCVTTIMSDCTIAYDRGGNDGYNMTAGTTYYIRIAKDWGPSNDAQFTVSRAANDNDLFANATNIPELTPGETSTPVTVDTTNATVEAGEDTHFQHRSRWWKYTTTTAQVVNVVTGSSRGIGTCVTTVMTSCTEGDAGTGTRAYSFAPNTTYYVAVVANDTDTAYLFLRRSGAGNDDFADATNVPELALGASTTLGVDVTGATFEPGEVDFAQKESRWWKYTPSADTSLAVTMGSAGSLGVCVTRSLSVCEQSQKGGNGTIGATLTSGTTYYIRVSNNDAETGTLTLRRGTADNDDFANATLIPALTPGANSGPISFDATGATAQDGEVDHGFNHSRWWKYTQPTSGILSISVAGIASSVDACISTGIATCDLWHNGGNGSGAIHVDANTIYYIRLADSDVAQGTFILSAPGNDNDLFANATTISELPDNTAAAPIRVDLTAATLEPDEIDWQGAGQSRWWKYTPSASYTLDLAVGGPGDITSCITTVINSCSEGSNGGNDHWSYSLTSGTTYYIRLDTWGSEKGWLFVSRGTPSAANPANDAFGSASAVSELGAGADSSTTFNLSQSTSEPGEVNYAGSKSQWWSYTPTSSYDVNVNINGPWGGVALCVTTAISSCTETSQWFANTAALSLTSGTTYYFRLSDNGGDSGTLTFSRPRSDNNDQFVNATNLSELTPGARMTQSVNFENASVDAGEVDSGGVKRSLWWRYTTTTAQTINIAAGATNAYASVCVTTSFSSCTLADTYDNPTAVNLSSGVTYYIRLNVDRSYFGTLSINRAGSGNDQFANATTIPELSVGATSALQTADLATGSVEPGEVRGYQHASYWWKYTPTASYSVTILGASGEQAPTICMTEEMTDCSLGDQYRGAKAYALTSGVTYYIRVASDQQTTPSFVVSRNGSGNDDMANATTITELSAGTKSQIIMADNSTTTMEPDETWSQLGRSNWWKYTPTSSYDVAFTFFEHYPAEQLCVTTQITSCTVGFRMNGSSVVYSFTSGTTYYIRVDAYHNHLGAFSMSRAIAANDEITNATTIGQLAEGQSVLYLAPANQATVDVATDVPSLWWKYTPAANQTVNLDTTVAGGEEPSCVTITTTDCSVDFEWNRGHYTYPLTAGTTYYFGAGIFYATSPTIGLRLTRTNTVTNDAFDHAADMEQADTTAPSSGVVFDGTNTGIEQRYSGTALDTLSANWSGFSDADSGIDHYEYAIGTSPGSTDVRSWTANGATSVTATGLSLHTSMTYYVSVRAVDGGGNASAVVSSPGQSVTPSLQFTVSGRSTTCNGQSATGFQSGSTATDVSLGRLAASVNGAAQDLSVDSNAANGFTVYVRTQGPTPNVFRDATGHSVADVTGTHSTPGPAPSTSVGGFGYTTDDSSTPFTPNTWAKLTNANETAISATPGTISKAQCVGYEAATTVATPAGSYAAGVVYTAVPNF